MYIYVIRVSEGVKLLQLLTITSVYIPNNHEQWKLFVKNLNQFLVSNDGCVENPPEDFLGKDIAFVA